MEPAAKPHVITYPGTLQAWIMLAMLVVAYMLSLIDRQIIALMVGPIRADLDISDFQIGLLQGFAFTLLYCSVGLPLGRIADKYNRKHVIIFGIVVWSVMTALCGLAGSFAALFIARVGVGFGEAALTPAAYSIIGDSFPPDKLVRANAIYSMAGLIGAGLSFLLGGSLVEYFESMPKNTDGLASWQRVFLTLGFAGIPITLLWLLVKEPARHQQNEAGPSSLSKAIAAVWQDRSRYLPYYVSSCFFAIISLGNMAWMPAHLGRMFSASPSEIGMTVGISLIIGALAGTYLGPKITEIFARRGHADSHLRTIRFAGIVMAPTLVAPLLPIENVVIGLFVINMIAVGSLPGVIAAAIQLLTPNRLRAVNGALYVMTVNIAGLAIGSAVIGFMSDVLFEGVTGGLGQSLAWVNITCVICLIGVTHMAIRGGKAAQDVADVLSAART